MFRNKFFVIFLIVAIILVGFLVITNIQNVTVKEPKISISEEEWDFGKIKEDERPEHIFVIKNNGGEELIISRVRAACGCTATMLSSDHILPGKSAELKVTFNPAGYDGHVKKSIYIESNDPEFSKLKLSIVADVETIPAPKAFLSNSQWDFELISLGDSPEFNFVIENKGELDLLIEKIDASEYINTNIALPLSISPNAKEEINFTYDSSTHHIGEVKESIRIYCNDPRRKVFSLRVSGYIKEKEEPGVSIIPAIAEFDLSLNSDEGAVNYLTIQNTGEKSIKVSSISTSANYIVPLRSEIELSANQKDDLQLILLKDDFQNISKNEDEEEYLYLTLEIPVEITR